MATKKVNIQLGLITKGFERQLAKTTRSLRDFGDSLQRIGADLSLGLTAPVLLAGNELLKAARKVDSFTQRLTVLSGGVEQGKKELLELQNIAKLPGLTLESAVEGYNRLLAIGFAGNEAKKVLIETANAVALYGGNVEQVNGVLLAFGQIIGKAQVQQEEINQLAERFPSIREALVKEFGTPVGEEITKQLADAGQSAADFVRRIVNQFSQLERAPITIEESFQTLKDQVTVTAGTIGIAIAKSTDFQAVMQGLGLVLLNIADQFRNLTTEQINSVVQWVALIAAIGPLGLVFGKIISIAGNLINVFKFLATTLSGPILIAIGAVVLAISIARGAGASWGQILGVIVDVLSLIGTTLFNVGKIIVAFVKLLGDAIGTLITGRFFKEAANTFGNFTKSVSDAIFSIDKSLVDTFSGNGAGQQIAKFVDESLVQFEKLKNGANSDIADIQKQFAGLLEIQGGTIRRSGRLKGGGTKKEPTREDILRGQITKELKAQFPKANEAQIDTGVLNTLRVKGYGEAIVDTTKSVGSFIDKLDILREQEALNKLGVTDFFAAYQAGFDEGGPIPTLRQNLKDLTDEAKFSAEAVQEFFLQVAGTLAGTLSEGFEGFFDILLAKGPNAFKAITDALLNLLKRLIVTMVTALALTAIFGALTGGGSNLFGGLAGIKSALGSKTLFGGFLGLSGFKIPGLAEGGIVTQPTAAVIGEAGKEAVIPLDRYNSLLAAAQVNTLGRKLEVRVTGSDLWFVLSEELRKRVR